MTDKTTDFPDFPKPDRLMSSVMSTAQEAVARVEQYRAGVEQMLAYRWLVERLGYAQGRVSGGNR